MAFDKALVSLHEISKSYPMGGEQVRVLGPLSLSIEEGEFVAIMGPSGSGKSTLLHILGCLDQPSSGRYVLANTEVAAMGDSGLSRLRGRSIGFIFQAFHLIPSLNVLENVCLALHYQGVDRRSQESRALEWLERVGMDQRLGHRPHQLSGGECQRVAIARALVADPELILADEPTGNLDSANEEKIIELLAAIHRSGKALVMVTHDQHMSHLAQRVLTMRDGRFS